jgi:hypothetical protein
MDNYILIIYYYFNYLGHIITNFINYLGQIITNFTTTEQENCPCPYPIS